MGSPAAPHPRLYPKTYKSVADQLLLLISRGMETTDETAASNCLRRIGYYRLSGYWYPFRKSHLNTNPLTEEILFNPATRKRQVIVEDDFRPGTTFQQVMDLYVFDKRLRMLFLDAIERVEVALRVDIALLIGARDPWAHRDPNQLRGRFIKQISNAGKTGFQEWLDRLDDSFNRSQEEFVKHFKKKYSGEPLPIWIAIELWDFGMLSRFLSAMKKDDQEQLSSKYGLPRPDLLTSWTRNINNVRNICAHHSRLWNRSPADQAAPPKPGEIAELDHLAADVSAQTRIYATAAILQHFLKILNPTSSWGTRLKKHCLSLPASSVLSLSQAGFPADWDMLPLWA